MLGEVLSTFNWCNDVALALEDEKWYIERVANRIEIEVAHFLLHCFNVNMIYQKTPAAGVLTIYG